MALPYPDGAALDDDTMKLDGVFAGFNAQQKIANEFTSRIDDCEIVGVVLGKVALMNFE